MKTGAVLRLSNGRASFMGHRYGTTSGNSNGVNRRKGVKLTTIENYEIA